MRRLLAGLILITVSTLVLGAEVLLEGATQPRLGDLSNMREERLIRALVTYNKTGFFIDRGTPRGFEYDLLTEYETFLNEGITKENERTRIFIIPVTFSDLGPALREGRGDLVAAGATITPFRKEFVDFSDPYLKNIDEVVVSHASVEGINSIDDLSGRKVNVLTGSSYAQHLEELNARFEQRGMAPVEIVKPGRYLQTEDILELVNADVIKLAIADSHIANAWAQVLPDIRIHTDISIHSNGEIAWAVRKDSPELLESLNAFLKTHKKGTLMGNIFFKRYFQNTKWIANPLEQEERDKLLALIETFQRFSEQYGFDWVAVAAQGYQESRLDQSVKSAAGAIGIMQLLPSTAADRNVGIPDISTVENNIHAGIRYLSFLRERYFSDPEIRPDDRIFFLYAAYNAGPARVRQLREKTAAMGLDPNRWFGNVERAAAAVIGRETVRYVANIYKYYIAYRLLIDAQVDRARERSGVPGE